MTEHYRGSGGADAGCGLMIILAGVAALTLAAIIGVMLFGVDWPVALAVIIIAAIVVYWLLARMSRR